MANEESNGKIGARILSYFEEHRGDVITRERLAKDLVYDADNAAQTVRRLIRRGALPAETLMRGQSWRLSKPTEPAPAIPAELERPKTRLADTKSKPAAYGSEQWLRNFQIVGKYDGNVLVKDALGTLYAIMPARITV